MRDEVSRAGLDVFELLGIEGPAWSMIGAEERWQDPAWREAMLFAARAVESETSMLGSAGHLMAVGRRTLSAAAGD